MWTKIEFNEVTIFEHIRVIDSMQHNKIILHGKFEVLKTSA